VAPSNIGVTRHGNQAANKQYDNKVSANGGEAWRGVTAAARYQQKKKRAK